LRIIILSK